MFPPSHVVKVHCQLQRNGCIQKLIPCLHIVMGADVLAKALVILDAMLEDSPGLLLWAVPGLVLAVIVLIVTVRNLRLPESA